MTAKLTVASRRAALLALAGGGVLLSACARSEDGSEKDVSANEDLMREHGVLRRLLVVYRESAGMIRASASTLDAGALASAADLFRRFGEDYHERELEERHIFPAVGKAGGAAAGLIDALKRQHDRGRQINQFVQDRCRPGRIAAADAEPLARALESFARMYEIHAAMEDTVVFPAWKAATPKGELDEMGEKFEAIERERFKGDGFDMAVDEVSRIEQRLGLAGLDRYTAPPP